MRSKGHMERLHLAKSKKIAQYFLLNVVNRRVGENSVKLKFSDELTLFCCKIVKMTTEIRTMLVEVYGRDAVSGNCAYNWFKHFWEVDKIIELS